MEDVEVLEHSRGAAGVSNARSPPPPSPPPPPSSSSSCQGGSLGLDVHERLEERVVVERMVPGRTRPATEIGVEDPRLVDKSKSLQISKVDSHSFPKI